MLLAFSVAPFVILTAGLIGGKMTSVPWLATLPVAMMIAGTVVAALPAGKIFGKFGYKKGFLLAGSWALAGCLSAFVAVLAGFFPLFCLGCFMMGNNLAFAQQSRFVCLIGLEENRKNVAVSLYLCGGVLAGFLGPQMGKIGRDWLAVEFAGGFLLQAFLLFFSVLVILLFYADVENDRGDRRNATKSPFLPALGSPSFFYPMLCGSAAYAGMAFVMTATPLAMTRSFSFDFEETTRVIQAHLLAMFLPSLFTGFLIDRFGSFKIMGTGVVMMILSGLFAMFDVSYAGFMVSLVFLGTGWNFMFVCSTAMLVRFNAPEKLLGLQYKNDFFVFFGQASGALLSGTALHRLGWFNLNLIPLPFFVFLLFLGFFMARRFEKKLLPA